MQSSKKIEAVTVCVDYADFIAWSAMCNHSIFDRWVVVTSKEDKKVKQICDHYSLVCVQSDEIRSSGTIDKWKAVNIGLDNLKYNDWVMFLDADIILPPFTRRVLNELVLDKGAIYGIDRLNCRGIVEWINYCTNPNLLVENWLLTPSGLEFGARIIHLYGQHGDKGKFGGYKPLGFGQIVHRSSFSKYPAESKTADHCDIVFANQYSRECRINIPEIIGVHLESVDSSWGSNWAGRKSLPFNSLPLINDYPCNFWCWLKRIWCWLSKLIWRFADQNIEKKLGF